MGEVVFCLTGWNVPLFFLENNAPKVLSLAVKKADDAYIVFVPLK